VKKNKQQEIALERIFRLFELAEKNFSRHPERSRRYINLARKISTRNKATIPSELKKRFCKKCGSFLKKENNAQHSKQGTILLIKCLECGFERKTSAESENPKN